jgi:hypothetical protein
MADDRTTILACFWSIPICAACCRWIGFRVSKSLRKTIRQRRVRESASTPPSRASWSCAPRPPLTGRAPGSTPRSSISTARCTAWATPTASSHGSMESSSADFMESAFKERLLRRKHVLTRHGRIEGRTRASRRATEGAAGYLYCWIHSSSRHTYLASASRRSGGKSSSCGLPPRWKSTAQFGSTGGAAGAAGAAVGRASTYCS